MRSWKGSGTPVLAMLVACGGLERAQTGDPITQAPPTRLEAEVAFANDEHRLLAVDRAGTGYALSEAFGSSRLLASVDGLRTWVDRGRLPSGQSFRVTAALSNGTLLADTTASSGHVLARSTDGGATWTNVLALGRMSLLTTNSVGELGGAVFLVEYQAYTDASVPIRLWASEDDGATWSKRHVFEGRRHAHGLQTDPDSGTIWVFFGDDEVRTGMERSVDGGRTFARAVEGAPGSAVDAVVTPGGLLYGQDIVYGETRPALVLLSDGAPRRLVELPGPSYSILALREGGYILGITREPGGDVYADGDESAHLLGSSDGRTVNGLFSYPRAKSGYARADVHWQLPSGEVVVELGNVEPVGGGYGYQLLTVRRRLVE